MSNTELFKTANAQVSLVVEALLDGEKDGKSYSKIAFVLIKRDEGNRAIITCRYFADVPSIKVLAWDLFQGRLAEEYNEYKRYSGNERAFKITPSDKAYRISLLNKEPSGKTQSLFFDLPRVLARQMAIEIGDFLRNRELAKAITEALGVSQSGKLEE